MIYRQKSATVGELRFYGNVSEWWISGDDYERTINEMFTKFERVEIRMHCYGGSVFEGEVIFNTNLRYWGKIKIIIDGVACSMASIIIMSVAEVEIADNAYIMIHSPSAVTQGTAKDHLSAGNLLTKMEKSFGKRYAARTGKSDKDVQAWFDGADHWFDADEALELGLATKILPAFAPNETMLGKPDPGAKVETLFNSYAALLTTPQAVTTKADNLTMKKALIEAFNLTGVTENSTDAEIVAALNTKLGSNQDTAKAQAKAAVAALIAFAENGNEPFTASQKASFEAIGEKAGIDALKTVLLMAKSQPAAASAATATTQPTATIPKIVSMIQPGNSALDNDRKGWGWDKWQKEAPQDLAALEDSEDPNEQALFKALYKGKYGVTLT